MKLLIAAGATQKFVYMKALSDAVSRLGVECKLVKESEYAAGFPSKNILEWFSNKKFKKLISEFKKKTGCPVIVNTSFNVRGEPIVNTLEDAFRCFLGTEIDILVIGNCYLNKENQDKSLKKDYKINFELD